MLHINDIQKIFKDHIICRTTLPTFRTHLHNNNGLVFQVIIFFFIEKKIYYCATVFMLDVMFMKTK